MDQPMRIALLFLSILATPALSQPADVLIEACNALGNATKRLECLRAAMTTTPPTGAPRSANSTQQTAPSNASRRVTPEAREEPKRLSAAEMFSRAFQLRDSDPKTAAELFKQGLQISPDDLDALRYLRGIQLKTGDEAGAQQSAQAIDGIAVQRGTLPAFPRLPRDIAVPIQVMRDLEIPRNQIPTSFDGQATNKSYAGKFIISKHTGGMEAFALGGLVEVLSYREQATKILTAFKLEGELLGGKGSQFRLATSHVELTKAGKLNSNDEVLTCNYRGVVAEVESYGAKHPGVLYECKTATLTGWRVTYAYFVDTATFSRVSHSEWDAAFAKVNE